MQKGVGPALAAALLFGAGTPFAKMALINFSASGYVDHRS